MAAADTTGVTLRLARAGDIADLTRLCAELGYPVAGEQVAERVARVLQDERRVLYVAEAPGGRAVGWVEVMLRDLLVSGRMAELNGLVVAADWRGRGVGRALMQAAESWARTHGCAVMSLRSKVVREDAHAFYRALGYEVTKTQLALRKKLME